MTPGEVGLTTRDVGLILSTILFTIIAPAQSAAVDPKVQVITPTFRPFRGYLPPVMLSDLRGRTE